MAIRIKGKESDYIVIPQMRINGEAVDAKFNFGYMWLKPFGFEKDKLSVEVFFYKSKSDRVPDTATNGPSCVVLINECSIFEPEAKNKIHAGVIAALQSVNPDVEFEPVDV